MNKSIQFFFRENVSFEYIQTHLSAIAAIVCVVAIFFSVVFIAQKDKKSSS